MALATRGVLGRETGGFRLSISVPVQGMERSDSPCWQGIMLDRASLDERGSEGFRSKILEAAT